MEEGTSINSKDSVPVIRVTGMVTVVLLTVAMVWYGILIHTHANVLAIHTCPKVLASHAVKTP